MFSHFRSRLSHLTSLPSSARRTLFWTASGLSWLPLLIFFQENYFQIMSVTGPSMYPFLNTDYHSSTRKNSVLVDMRRPWRDLRRGTVIAFWSPANPERLVVKRVIALEGDEVTTRCPPYPFPKEVVPYGHVWVEGDTLDGWKTHDSSYYGPISKNLIVGQLRAVVWPWSSAAWINWEDYRGSPRVAQNKHPVEPVETFSG